MNIFQAIKCLLIALCIMVASVPPLHADNALDDLGFREYFGRYKTISKKFRAILDGSCSTRLLPYQVAGSDGKRSVDWGFTLSIWNKSDRAVSIPVCALSSKFPIIKIVRNGEETEFRGPGASLRNAEKDMVVLPPGAEIAFTLNTPLSHSLADHYPAGEYVISWPFHRQAKCRFTIGKDGVVKMRD